MGNKRSNVVFRLLENTFTNPLLSMGFRAIGNAIDDGDGKSDESVIDRIKDGVSALGELDKESILPEFMSLRDDLKEDVMKLAVEDPLGELLSEVIDKLHDRWDDPSIKDEARERRVEELKKAIMLEYYQEAKERFMAKVKDNI